MYVLYKFQYSSFSLGNKILQQADVLYSSNYQKQFSWLYNNNNICKTEKVILVAA